MAKAYRQSDFNSLMEIVQNVDVRVKEYLELAGYDKWSRVYAPVHRGWTITSNIESINSALVTPSTDYLYAVNDKGKSFIVCLENKKCSCRQFQYDEIPCPDALAILKKKKFKAGPYCSDYYKPEIVLKTYEILVYPFPDVID
ncbi:uncharacterized protein LOC107871782 [Capsicum annuum]|uniref:uncharacterized protein LOC107871782 n=1 Tax=Capsicum annuum TaxID=4072 RepID=UPI001FB0A6AF|nr:uncharacterized protein LOC107871782 [Capsicum annuum]